jgi:hypothetical protein
MAKIAYDLEMKRLQVLSMSSYAMACITPLGRCLYDQNEIKVKILKLEIEILNLDMEYLRSQLTDTFPL